MDYSSLTGFIVKVTPKHKDISYLYNVEYDTSKEKWIGEKKQLQKSQEFTGYFGQMTEKSGEDWLKAHIRKLNLFDKVNKLYKQEKEAIFNSNDINIEIIAKRGPQSNNDNLPEKYDIYETWNKF